MKLFKTIISERKLKEEIMNSIRQHEKQDKIQAIRELKEKGLIQKEIAKILTVTQQYVSEILKELQ